MSRRQKNPYESSTFGNALSLRVDGAIGAMSLSPNGRDAVLAGRRGLFIIDLDDPFAPPRWLHHITSWEVADVQWSPHHSVKPSWCISTSNQKALLWDLARPSNNAIVNVLHEHSRAITDINFHPFDPELLATCSVDMFVLGWDMRTPRRPVNQWAEWRAGATQVKWNHKNPFEIASSHDNNLYVWDTRKGSLPLIKVDKAHNGKINGIDFSRGLSNIITCSNDKTIKLWNLLNADNRPMSNGTHYFDSKKGITTDLLPSIIINCDYPIARARSLPFGEDKSCGIMPLRGGSDAINVVNYNKAYEDAIRTNETQHINADPIYSFKGHNGPIKDFLWRQRPSNYENVESKKDWTEYQLVTWSSQDYDLKLWNHKDELYDCVNYNPSYKNIVGSFENEEVTDKKELKVGDGVLTSEKKKYKIPTPVNYRYNTYRMEPTVTLEDIQKRQNGDVLSSLVLYHIAKNRHSGYASQLNHLHWISGVRMGKSSHGQRIESGSDGADADDGPTNLGEEVSIVGHKFPKVHFEKISVSTGDLILSLRGPIPEIPNNPETAAVTEQVVIEKGNDSISEDKDVPVDDKPDKSDNNSKNTSEASVNRDSKKSEKFIRSSNVNNGIISNVMGTVSNDSKELESTNIPKLPSSATVEDSTQEQKLIFIRVQIKLPDGYPCLSERNSQEGNGRKVAKNKKQKLISFNIEETHELTNSIKQEMQKNLNEIAHFYSNMFDRFCLEPCLRYLMGDKVDLDASLIEDANDKHNEILPENPIEEVGTEGWADDLIRQQPDFEKMPEYSSGDDDADEDDDLIPNIDDSLFNSDFQRINENMKDEEVANNVSDVRDKSHVPANQKLMDSTPIPKGCGAVWSNTGQLVCFFIPKNNESENKDLQKFNIFKFTDGGFSLKTNGSNHSHHHEKKLSIGSGSIEEKLDNSDDGSNSSEDGDLNSSTSDSSDDSFSEEWSEMNQNDIPSRSRIPGLFKLSVGLGGRFLAHENMQQSYKKYDSQGGTTSNYKSSAPEETTKSKKRRERSKKNLNIVGIFNFDHLIPSKIQLAREYRVLGDSPENLARYNSSVALKYGLMDVSQVWKVVEMILVKGTAVEPYLLDFTKNHGRKMGNHNTIQENQTSPFESVNQNSFYWGNHPFGYTWLIKGIMNYFKSEGNIQMLAMLSCILYENKKNIINDDSDTLKAPVHTPYTTQPLPPPPSAPLMKLLHQNRLSQYEPGSSFNDLSSNAVSSWNNGRESFSYNRSDNDLITDGVYQNLNGEPSDSIAVKAISPEKFSFFKRKGSYLNHNSNESYSLNDITRTESSASLMKQKPAKYRSPKQRTIDRRRIIPSVERYNSYKEQRNEPEITLELNNVEDLDLFENLYTHPLLDPKDELEIRNYREQYAEMLYVWGLPINRIKILKFNHPEGTNEAFLKGSTFKFHECAFGVSKPTIGRGIQPLKATVKDKIQKSKPLKSCSLCNLCVTKNVVICFDCEHVLHLNCAIQWWSQDEDNEFNLFCPSGCGCECKQFKSI